MRGFHANYKLWAGGALIVASAFTLKQVIWMLVEKDVRKNRDNEHHEASLALQTAHATAKKYAMTNLSEEQVASLKKQRESLKKD
jgi:hypothetical protein